VLTSYSTQPHGDTTMYLNLTGKIFLAALGTAIAGVLFGRRS
jgi:hypothetical protein